MSDDFSEAEVARHWDANAGPWAAEVRRGADVAREWLNNPAFLAFIGDLNGRRVLDAGCGEGYNTRILARRGARVTGVDISERMIELAREAERAERLGIRYERASYADLGPFADASFDAVVSFMALMDGPHFDRAMREAFRVLRPGGMVAFSITHPCFITRARRGSGTRPASRSSGWSPTTSSPPAGSSAGASRTPRRRRPSSPCRDSTARCPSTSIP
jgi:SAM-dependent methyltransferase